MGAISNKSYSFAIRVTFLYRSLCEVRKEFIISKQILRSGTAIGALVKEAEHGQSKPDFLNKMNVALKEANETKYWLMLLKDTGYINENDFKSINKDCIEIVSLLASIVKSTKLSLKR